ncbi:MAG: addiction module antitoxin RelB [Gammaproteobacteria bacterium HGW-Gammaproteobacteria-3]|nr:MAG: addiction module antitoxin RelB [Gammaproteobacteria bacterium HGW-Gammaproteobacteria-3]
MNIETISHEALLLPPRERAQLAERLLSSLDTLTEAEIEQLWFQEAARRADEMNKGRAQRISADVVYREARALLK